MVGAGISGLGAAYALAQACEAGVEVEVFERDTRAGGHSNTVLHDGLALDTGFLVHNGRNYPLLTRLFGELGVGTYESEMSFAVSCAGCGLEWSGTRPFAPRRNAASPRFYSLLWEVARWLTTARRSLDTLDEGWSLQRYLDDRGYSQRFRRHFLVPLTAALWSTAPGRALEFPAATATRFFGNHGMLGLGRFRWRTVAGGSRTYVDDHFVVATHTATSLLPRARGARASWSDLLGDDGRPTITYWLNRLQKLETDTDYCVTLNAPVREDAAIARFTYAHPLYTAAQLVLARSGEGLP